MGPGSLPLSDLPREKTCCAEILPQGGELVPKPRSRSWASATTAPLHQRKGEELGVGRGAVCERESAKYRPVGLNASLGKHCSP